MAARTLPVSCAVCGQEVDPTERAFYDDMNDVYECLECADERDTCAHCMNRYPKSEAIVVPQPPPYQELRYCTVACVVDQAAQAAAQEDE